MSGFNWANRWWMNQMCQMFAARLWLQEPC